MEYQNDQIRAAADSLKKKQADLVVKSEILRDVELKALFDEIKTMPDDQRAKFGQELNNLKDELTKIAESEMVGHIEVAPIDVTAPYDPNLAVQEKPTLFPAQTGSVHPITSELNLILDIFYRMGFEVVESREIDDDYHMFTSLNFPLGHPARDDYDTFMTKEFDQDGKPFIAPAHTSSMQNRVLRSRKPDLEAGIPIAAVIPGRVFRNEDIDPRHEHTFYQLEGIYVDKNVNVGNLISTLRAFFESYYGRELKVKTQPFYFPFTEPSFEFAAECVFCEQRGCSICSFSGWIELLGCGMIHPNVLREAGIDSEIYSGFAWGGGIERPVMLKFGVEDIRYFESGRLNFLRQFAVAI